MDRLYAPMAGPFAVHRDLCGGRYSLAKRGPGTGIRIPTLKTKRQFLLSEVQ